MTEEIPSPMEVDRIPNEGAALPDQQLEVELMEAEEEEEEEEVSDLVQLLESAEAAVEAATTDSAISNLSAILTEPQNRFGPRAASIKERAIYSLTRAYCSATQYHAVVDLLTGATCRAFFDHSTKAKCAKVVRAVLDLLCSLAPTEFTVQAQVCRNLIAWCKAEKRTFLRQRVETKLAAILFAEKDYSAALSLIDDLLVELKKLDDKQLLVEAHLLQSKIHHALRGIAKAKAALTASRTCANAIYVAPALQATIDSMSGTLHCEEGDYNTAHSYFLEAFESLDQLDDRDRALQCLKYMMLCRILDSLVKALKLSAKGGVGTMTGTLCIRFFLVSYR
jgi:26S proteasome regulatory subunit N6